MVRGVYEYTDTFGGEPNYCWVKRGTVHGKNDRAVIRAVKRETGLNGIRGRVSDCGGMYEFRPYRMCRVLSISFE